MYEAGCCWREKYKHPLTAMYVLLLLLQEMAALLQRVIAGREEQKKQRQMDLERLLQR